MPNKCEKQQLSSKISAGISAKSNKWSRSLLMTGFSLRHAKTNAPAGTPLRRVWHPSLGSSEWIPLLAISPPDNTLMRSASHHWCSFLTRNRLSYIPQSNTEIIYAVPRAWSLKSVVNWFRTYWPQGNKACSRNCSNCFAVNITPWDWCCPTHSTKWLESFSVMYMWTCVYTASRIGQFVETWAKDKWGDKEIRWCHQKPESDEVS